jgi:hypothetical protein
MPVLVLLIMKHYTRSYLAAHVSGLWHAYLRLDRGALTLPGSRYIDSWEMTPMKQGVSTL